MKNKKWFVILCGVLMFGLFCGIGMSEGAMEVQAAKIVKKDKTPAEPASSDLAVVQTVTKLVSKR